MCCRSNNGQTHNVFENGYTLDLRGGTPQIRPTTPEDTAFFMTSLSPGGTGTTGNSTTQDVGTSIQQASFNDTYDEIINEATTTQIQDQILRELARVQQPTTGKDSIEQPQTPVQTAQFGYASGIYIKDSGPSHERVGTLTNFSPSEVGVLFSDGKFAGAKFDLFADVGSQHGGGGTEITFAPVGNINVPEDVQLPSSGLFFGLASHELSPSSIKVFQDTTFPPPELANPST